MDWETLAKGLSIVIFVIFCWVVQRVVNERSDCIKSEWIHSVRLGSNQIVENCKVSSRLKFNQTLSYESLKLIKQLQSLEVEQSIVPIRHSIVVSVDQNHPELFSTEGGILTVGVSWINKGYQLQRELLSNLVHLNRPRLVNSSFELEILAEFLIQSANSAKQDLKHLKFSTASPKVSGFCKSEFVSLRLLEQCEQSTEKIGDQFSEVWGLRPLIGRALAKIFLKLPLGDQFRIVESLKNKAKLSPIKPPKDNSAQDLSLWLAYQIKQYAVELFTTANGQINRADNEQFNRVISATLKELEVEAPVKWELTVDVTHTPVWKEIVEQLKRRVEIVKNERILIFTPEGQLALPAELKVAWNTADIQTQKHVLIACDWPAPDHQINIRSRQFFAEKSCAQLTRPFWD